MMKFILEHTPLGLQWDAVRKCGAMFWLRLDEDKLTFKDVGDKLLRKKISKSMDRKARDEVVFWFIMLGNPQRLKAAMTSLFTGDPELIQFLSRDLSAPEQQSMVQKNAFRLLQLHRYYNVFYSIQQKFNNRLLFHYKKYLTCKFLYKVFDSNSLFCSVGSV